jgi:mannosyltransferase OCH1-like enzyme
MYCYYYLILLIILFIILIWYLINKSYNKYQKIPKIIVQTWKSNKIPEQYIKLIENVKLNNPSYKYMFFTDENIDTFLKQNYPEYYNTYLKLPIKIQKIDFFRYIAIYHYGGFYLDLDMDVMKSFDDLLKYSCIFPIDEYIYINTHNGGIERYKSFYNNNQSFLLGQYAFAASPKHPFIKEIIERIHNNIYNYIKNVDNKSHDYIYKTTGPDFITEVYMTYKNKNNIKILDVGKRQYFGDYARHLYFGTWKKDIVTGERLFESD